MVNRFLAGSLAFVLAVAAPLESARSFWLGKEGENFGRLGASGKGVVSSGTGTSTGGSRAILGNNTVVTFKSNGTFTSTAPFTGQLLVVGGGGGGGGNGGGGGGGGGVNYLASVSVPAGTYTVTVGASGAAGTASGFGGNGGNSSFGALLTAVGGGGGAEGSVANNNGLAGGSGGGSGANGGAVVVGGAGTAGQGNAGGGNGGAGIGNTAPFPSGGGGGGGTIGATATANNAPGNGGDGVLNSITGTAQYYGPGGGGSIFTNGASQTQSSGGLGNSPVYGRGAGNTFGGVIGMPAVGGGAGGGATGSPGFAGGSGQVILVGPTSLIATSQSYTGQVATRSFVPYLAQASTTGWNSRTAHYARVAITSLQVCDVNWYATTTGETSNTGTSLITRTIEYPAGTYTRVTWSSANSVTLSAGQTLCSDAVSVSIPSGALFFDKKYQVNSTQVLIVNGSPKMNLALGDAVNNANVDQTTTTTADSGGGNLIPPAAIIASTSSPSICAIGSSRMSGVGDTVVDSTGDSGYSRMFGGSFAYINMGIPGDVMSELGAGGGAKRIALALQSCSHLWMDPGLNDLNNAKTAAQVEGYISFVVNQWPSLSHVIINDEAAWTTSSDGWTTTSGQTVKSFEAQRVLLNTYIDGLAGYNQIVNANTFDGNGTNSQFWNNPVVGGSQFTADGIHENSPSLVTLAASARFNPALVTNP